MWELIWLMVIMKIPILYLCWVVYWSIKGQRQPEEPAALVATDDGSDHPPWTSRRRPRRPGPHGRPDRGYPRISRAPVRT
ncbi:MAG TPA: hypothetical protein VF025_08840 [Gaiellaceae bacterium]